MQDIPNWMVAGVSLIPTGITALLVLGKKDNDVSSIKRRLDKLDGTDRDEKIAEQAVLQDRVDKLQGMDDRFNALNNEFVKHQSNIEATMRTMTSNMRYFRSTLEGLSRQMAEFARGGPRSEIITLHPPKQGLGEG